MKPVTVDLLMSETKKTQSPEFKTSGTLAKKGVVVADQSSIDALTSRGYGTLEDKVFTLTFFEALYLVDKDMLEVKDENGKVASFQCLLQCYEAQNENGWVRYLVYRDLRSRGYVAREGFGAGIDFRMYERGEYGKDTAPYLVLSMQEGKPLGIDELADALRQCQSQKKELTLAVMNRRGEIVYYSVSQLTFK
jgi:tRNA-intron endonuclease